MQQALRFVFQPRTRVEAIVPALLWAVMLFVLSSIPGNKYPEVGWRFADKYVHVLLYLPFGILLARWLGQTWNGMAAIAAGWFYGATDEFHQLWTPLRSCSLSDWITDAIAVCLGVVLLLAITRRLAPTVSAANSLVSD
jgi:VanZ family protein